MAEPAVVCQDLEFNRVRPARDIVTLDILADVELGIYSMGDVGGGIHGTNGTTCRWEESV
jgi:hypothetical protein